MAGMERVHGMSPILLAILLVLSAGLLGRDRGAWADQLPEDVECSWTGVKCCFTERCECCPRGGKPTGKIAGERGCRLLPVTADELPISGFLASQDCLTRVGPWSVEGIRECQGSLLWMELRTVEDLSDMEYSYLQCDEGEPYLVPARDEGYSTNQTSWGSLKMMYR